MTRIGNLLEVHQKLVAPVRRQSTQHVTLQGDGDFAGLFVFHPADGLHAQAVRAAILSMRLARDPSRLLHPLQQRR
ncbi:MAG: hypothetical protein SF123_14130, partial [Chloroflexota bacterium]|nr:hypothetical protein [Chloroflexota bacterium]